VLFRSEGRSTPPSSERRSFSSRPITSSTGRKARHTWSRTRRTRSLSTVGRNSRPRLRQVTMRGSCAAPGSSAGRARTSSGRCSAWERSATRLPSSTTSAAPRRTSVTWLRRCVSCSNGPPVDGIWRPTVTARGRRSRRRYSKRWDSIAGCAGSRPPSWDDLHDAPRTRCSAASGRGHRSFHTGGWAYAPALNGLESEQDATSGRTRGSSTRSRRRSRPDGSPPDARPGARGTTTPLSGYRREETSSAATRAGSGPSRCPRRSG